MKSPIKINFKKDKDQPAGLLTMDLDGSISFATASFRTVAHALVDPAVAHIQINQGGVHATIRKQWIASNDQSDEQRASAVLAARVLYGRTGCPFTVHVIANGGYEGKTHSLQSLKTDGTNAEWAFHYGALCSLLADESVSVIDIVDEAGALITICKKWVVASMAIAA